MNKVKFAVVGCGSIGKRHLAVIDAEPKAELVAICDLDEKKCKEFSALYKVPYYTGYNELLKRDDIEVINISTPHGLHAEMAMEAARHKKHALVEKPMALYVDDCRKMIEVAKENGVKLYMVKQNRFNAPIALTKRAFDEGRLGKIFMVQCNVMWNRHQDYYESSDWRGRKAMEGGSLQTQVSHFIDLMIWWLGDLVESKAIMDTMNHDIEIEDCGAAVLRFKSGTIGSLLWTTCVYNKNFEGSITLIGEKGTIKIGGQYLNKIEFWDVQSYPLPDDVEFTDKPNIYGKYQGTSSNHDKVVQELTAALMKERSNCVEGDEGIKTIEAIEMIYRSAGN